MRDNRLNHLGGPGYIHSDVNWRRGECRLRQPSHPGVPTVLMIFALIRQRL